MTDKEKAIVMAHTGICTLAGDKFQIFHKYVEDIMGRPVMTHELLFLGDEIKEKSKADFIALCEDESGSENLNKTLKQELKQESILDKLKAELHSTAEMHEDGDYYLRDEWIDEYFDKYKAESE